MSKRAPFSDSSVRPAVLACFIRFSLGFVFGQECSVFLCFFSLLEMSFCLLRMLDMLFFLFLRASFWFSVEIVLSSKLLRVSFVAILFRMISFPVLFFLTP